MRPIRLKKPPIDYPDECSRLQDALINKGYYATVEQVDELWRMYSEDHHCAGWVTMGKMSNEELYKAVREYFDAQPDSGTDTRYL
jgi:hypothetical protein